MNDLGIALVWCALQATLYLLAGTAIYVTARRLGPAIGASAAAISLAMLAGVTVAAFCPWPRWWSLTAGEQAATAIETTSVDTTTTEPRPGAATGAVGEPGAKQPVPGIAWSDYWRVFRAELDAAGRQQRATGTSRRWPMVVATVFLLSVTLALVRLAIGIAAVKRYRGRLTPISDRRLADLCQTLAGEMGCRRPVELMQSSALSTPATMGFRRPAIVLPEEWREWTDDERRVVLAHELAHISRHDYATWLLAKFAAALHAYHPLVHWLAARLRLEQELAADALAARVSGGRETYLFTLAQMALRQDDHRVAWAARPFLPSRGTLLRRIEMLSENKRMRNVAVTPPRAAALAALAGLIALIVSGVRAPLGDAPRQANAAPQEKPAVASPPKPREHLALDYVPPRSVAVVVVRPADLLAKPEMASLAKLLNDGTGLEKRLGLKIENIEEAALAVTRLPDPPSPPQAGQPPRTPSTIDQSLLFVLRYKEALDWKSKLAESFGPSKLVEEQVGGKSYYRSADRSDAARPALFMPDDRTVVVGPEIDLQRAVIGAGRTKADWAADWQKWASGEAAATIHLAAWNPVLSQEMKHGPQKSPFVAVFSPLWEKGDRLFASLHIGDGLNARVRIACRSAEDAERVKATVEAVLTLARNGLDELDRAAAKATAAQAAAMVPLIDLANEVLKRGKISTENSQVDYQTTLDVDVAETAVAVVAPAVIAARQAAQRAQTANNMKQIMLAMHNYHDVYGHFPPPVVIGPDGKTPHSWRVEILPFVEQQQLYTKYKMDEPWDSPNNKGVLAQVPPVYRDPAAAADSQETNYFAFVGPDTALGSKDSKGTKIQEITDGTSNTICIVEAKKPVPWTKPEDIDYDAAKPMPRVGGLHPGGFWAGFCDGSVRFLGDNIDQQVLRNVITKAGGELVTLP